MKVQIKIETEFGWGERLSHVISGVERNSINVSEDRLGLNLTEGKSILKEIQRMLLQDQVEEIIEIARVCRSCGEYLAIHDRRQRRIDTLFGKVTVEAPLVRTCINSPQRSKTFDC